jgi:murein DD-endopeptidase MepM/ murein hydrolase activator NlpD
MCWTQDHTGLTFTVPEGTAVTAAESGKVVSAGPGPNGRWMLVAIRHADGLVSLYGYDGELRVNRGDQVAAGQVIASPGSAEDGYAALLRFELWRKGIQLDPLPYLELWGT